GIQIVSARIGRVTGHGLAANIRDHFPAWLLNGVVALLVIANTINIAADLGAMGNALQLLIGGRSQIYVVFFALVSLTLQIFVPFPKYAPILKWLTCALFAYVATVFAVQVPWVEALHGAILPQLSFKADYVSTLVAVLGTTIRSGRSQIYVVFFALVSLTLQIFVPFPKYAPILKWLTCALFAYVATVFAVQVPWVEALHGAILPQLSFKADYVSTLVAVLGTTI